MENQNPKLKPVLLILGILIILTGGGVAIWAVVRNKEQQAPHEAASIQPLPPVTGRKDVTDLYTEEELQHSALADKSKPDRTPEYQVVLISSKEGKQLIEDRMRKIQLNKRDADFLRAKHKIGHTLVNIRSLSHKANKAIDKMFGLVAGVTEGNYLTYPIYGKFEPLGQALRKDINTFLANNGQDYNLSMRRHRGNAWWFGSVGLNLLYGSKKAHVHSADKIWWYAGGQEARDGLDFFKLVNGHDVDDRRLLDMRLKNGKAVFHHLQINQAGVQGTFAAWGIYRLVQLWKEQLDLFDKVTREEAITALEREGLLRRI